MIRNPITSAAALAAFLALTACGGSDEAANDAAGNNAVTAEANSAAAISELPPSITASRTYRCRDNSLVYADFYTNNTVRVRQGSQTAEQTTLTAEGGNPPYRASGWSISANADEVTITQPGRGSQSCHI